ncbi:MAG TPA: hypothetical protein DEB46_06860 [Myxococcales bacterium]|nr:hypothetical protein [Myxococcales bacterium]
MIGSQGPRTTEPASLRADALAIFNSGLDQANPRDAVQRFLDWDAPILALDRHPAPPKLYDLNGFRHVWIIGAGKASAAMAEGLHLLIGDQITGGLVIVPEGQGDRNIGPIQLLESSHPRLSPQSRNSAQRMADFASGMTGQDLCIALISGGASALVFDPVDDLELATIQSLIDQLSDGGATIQELNSVRRLLCRLKGGGLSRLIAPCELLTLVASDVVGNTLGDVGSGLTISSPEAEDTVDKVLSKYRIDLSHQPKVSKALRKIPEPAVPTENEEVRLILDNSTALLGCAAKARSLGYEAVAVTASLVGSARDLGPMLAQASAELLEGSSGLRPPAVLLFGGESTVRIAGRGRGGRNQELALAAMKPWSALKNAVLLSAGTDGDDGGTGVAGAVVDCHSWDRLCALGEDPNRLLDDNDSGSAFEKLGDQVLTGITGTNVMDLQIIVAGPKPVRPQRPLLPG